MYNKWNEMKRILTETYIILTTLIIGSKSL